MRKDYQELARGKHLTCCAVSVLRCLPSPHPPLPSTTSTGKDENKEAYDAVISSGLTFIDTAEVREREREREGCVCVLCG